VVGADFPQRYRRRLESLNIDLAGLEQKSGKTFYWKARYAADLLTRETLALELGVYEQYHPRIPAKSRGSDYVLIANLMPQLQQEALTQLERPDLVVLGTIDYWIRTARPYLVDLLPRAHGFIANEEEMRLLGGSDDPVEAARNVAKLGARFVVVILAERGSVLVLGQEHFHVPAFPCANVQDPTGAGDSFAGGLVASLALGREKAITQKNLVKAMHYGTALASFSVESYGIEGLCRATRKEVEERVSILTENGIRHRRMERLRIRIANRPGRASDFSPSAGLWFASRQSRSCAFLFSLGRRRCRRRASLPCLASRRSSRMLSNSVRSRTTWVRCICRLTG